MPSVPFPKEWRLLSAPSFGISVTDVKLHCWTRRQALDNLAVFGGQTLFVAADEARWVNSRALRPHLGKTYEGAKSPPAPTDPPVASSCAMNLRVQEALSYGFPDDRARVPTNTPLHVQWDAPDSPIFEQPEPPGQDETPPRGGGWQWWAMDAPTGQLLASGVERTPLLPGQAVYEARISSAALGVDPRSLLFYVAATGVLKPYRFPVDYQNVTGESEARPQRFLWRHPVKGPLHFDPKYRVGALPYDRSDPVQAALLAETERLEEESLLILREEWADFLITFNADGSQSAAGGEFSCLKIYSGLGWCGDKNVAVEACAGVAVWTGDEVGNLTPLVVEPRLRRVFHLKEEADGSFWITGDVAGRSGSQTALLRVDENWQISLAAYGDPFAVGGQPNALVPPMTSAHSRVLLGSRAGRAIYREKGIIHVLTLAGKMRLKQTTSGAWLFRVAPGGRSLATLTRLDGSQVNGYTVDPDVANSSAFERFSVPRGGGHVVTDAAFYPGTPLAKHLSSALCAKETFFGIVSYLGKESEDDNPKAPIDQTNEQTSDDQQGLSRFTLGGIEVLAWWKASTWDMSRVIPWAKGVYAFGFNDKGIPRAHRLSLDGDGLLEMGLSLPYLVTWGECGPTPDGESETLRIVGNKFFGRRAMPGSFAAEGAYGQRGAGGVSPGAGPVQTDFVWDSVENAFVLSLAGRDAAGFGEGAFPPYLQWNELGSAWLACALAPQAANGSPLVPYLIFDGTGDPLAYRPGAGVVLPQNVLKWGGIRFTAGTCQGVVTRPPTVEANCGAMDVALVVDSSGSMGGSIANVRSELGEIVKDIAASSGGDYRLSLVTFTDEIVVDVPFAPLNAAPIIARLETLEASGGAGEPEASDEAIRTCVLALPAEGRPQIGDFVPFRESARKIIIMVTDARPASFDDDFIPGVHDANALAVANEAAAAGILISAVYVPRDFAQDVITGIMETYAAVTGGLFIRTQSDGRGTGSAISDVVNSCGGNAAETYVEYCTDDVVTPVASCGSARCVFDDSESVRVGHFRLTSPGPINAIWFQEKGNPEAFAAMCRAEQRVWARIDGASALELNPAGELSEEDLTTLEDFNIAVPVGREFWLPRPGKTVDIIVILDEGISLEVDFTAAH